MNPIHKAFAGQPCLRLTLPALFDVLDKMDPQERFGCLSNAMQVVLMIERFRTSARDYDTAYQEFYDQFKERCLALQGMIHPGFLAYSVVAQALAWLCIKTNEQHIEEVVQNIRTDLQQSERNLRAGAITQEQHERAVREGEEAVNNARSDRLLVLDRYNRFCEMVVKPFLDYPPDKE